MVGSPHKKRITCQPGIVTFGDRSMIATKARSLIGVLVGEFSADVGILPAQFAHELFCESCTCDGQITLSRLREV